MTELECLKEQSKILLNALKEIAHNKKTPAWISELCKREAMRAHNVNVDPFGAESKADSKTEDNGVVTASPISDGDLVYNNNTADKCVYQVVRLSTTIQGVNLWDLRIIKGDAKNPTGRVAHNVPETVFHK